MILTRRNTVRDLLTPFQVHDEFRIIRTQIYVVRLDFNRSSPTRIFQEYADIVTSGKTPGPGICRNCGRRRGSGPIEARSGWCQREGDEGFHWVLRVSF